MATRQTSSSGRPKSPRIQVVLPEELCERLAAMAETEARTVSNMARVLIQQGLDRFEQRQRQVLAEAARRGMLVPVPEGSRRELLILVAVLLETGSVRDVQVAQRFAKQALARLDAQAPNTH
jgi:predicted DNA-binding protein